MSNLTGSISSPSWVENSVHSPWHWWNLSDMVPPTFFFFFFFILAFTSDMVHSLGLRPRSVSCFSHLTPSSHSSLWQFGAHLFPVTTFCRLSNQPAYKWAQPSSDRGGKATEKADTTLYPLLFNHLLWLTHFFKAHSVSTVQGYHTIPSYTASTSSCTFISLPEKP